MPISITRVYTRLGDQGETALVGGTRVPKDSPRIAAYGTVDELNAVVGLVRVFNAERLKARGAGRKHHAWLDGVLYEKRRAARQFVASITARVKIMAGLNIAEKRLPQDGRIRRKVAGKDVDMRVATAPTANGERVTIRDSPFGADHRSGTAPQFVNGPRHPCGRISGLPTCAHAPASS